MDSDCLRAKALHAAGRDDEAAALFRSVVRDAADIGFRMALVDSLDGLAAIESRRRRRRGRPAGRHGRPPAGRGSAAGLGAGRIRRRTVASLVADLGAERFDRLHAEGHALSLPAIVETAAASG